MVDTSVNEVSELINQQIEIHEDIHDHLLKAEAIANGALSEDFLNKDKATTHAYLWALCDIIGNTRNLNEKALNGLLVLQK
ncbi:MAG: hypothetical protein JO131_01355 [Gammaproteobacteria bacterium]|nr:hypothetical protein [Gammaproteobacteria bacterium]